jgi:hypothetical protein
VKMMMLFSLLYQIKRSIRLTFRAAVPPQQLRNYFSSALPCLEIVPSGTQFPALLDIPLSTTSSIWIPLGYYLIYNVIFITILFSSLISFSFLAVLTPLALALPLLFSLDKAQPHHSPMRRFSPPSLHLVCSLLVRLWFSLLSL